MILPKMKFARDLHRVTYQQSILKKTLVSTQMSVHSLRGKNGRSPLSSLAWAFLISFIIAGAKTTICLHFLIFSTFGVGGGVVAGENGVWPIEGKINREVPEEKGTDHHWTKPTRVVDWTLSSSK